MQIDDKYWGICLQCDKCYDDDEALYCNEQVECEVIKANNAIEK